jgi:hypothetical protein
MRRRKSYLQKQQLSAAMARSAIASILMHEHLFASRRGAKAFAVVCALIMDFDLTDDEPGALTRLLRDTIGGDRYPLSPRVRTLQAIP